jgi:hypothetical protein
MHFEQSLSLYDLRSVAYVVLLEDVRFAAECAPLVMESLARWPPLWPSLMRQPSLDDLQKLQSIMPPGILTSAPQIPMLCTKV